jgi:glycerol-3-phosphate dehydrogenase (NAD(P)+)
MARIGVIGGGAFGTAMACVVRRSGHETVIWAREPGIVNAINRDGLNPLFLPNVRLVAGIVATGDMAAAANADFLLLAPPAQHMRSVTTQLHPHLRPGTPVVTCSKGLERGTCAFMSQVLAETLPGAPVAVLSGPSFANEIAIDLPTAVALACPDLELGRRLARDIGNPRFRVVVCDDVVGVHLGGVLKNVVAIACGIATGMRLGNNASSTLFTLGIAEAVRLGLVLGAKLDTFMGLAGIGDMDLSCHSPISRNMSLGIALGEGRRLHDVLGERVTVQEGVHSAEAVAALARRLGVDMPITAALDRVLNHGADRQEAIAALIGRPVGPDPFAAA